MEITVEGLVALIAAVTGATMWIVSAIHGVRDSIKDLAVDLRKDISEHDSKLTEIDGELDDHNERLEHLEKGRERRYINGTN